MLLPSLPGGWAEPRGAQGLPSPAAAPTPVPNSRGTGRVSPPVPRTRGPSHCPPGHSDFWDSVGNIRGAQLGFWQDLGQLRGRAGAQPCSCPWAKGSTLRRCQGRKKCDSSPASPDLTLPKHAAPLLSKIDPLSFMWKREARQDAAIICRFLFCCSARSLWG